jgi:AcrR family transcriptional regulator
MGDTSHLTPSTRRAPDLRDMILAAMGELLAERRLEEITVLDLTERAQVSRASFYVYFESKYAPLAALAEQVTDGIYRDCWAPFVAGEESPSLETYGEHLLQTIELWDQHRAVLVAAAAAWRADPAAIGGWEALWSRYVSGQRGLIERARSRGEAPDGLDAQTLAAALTWMHENALYLAFVGAVPEFRDHRRLAETQSTIWWRAIFGG